MLANPLNERIVRLDHDKGVSARDGHCHGSLSLSCDPREDGLSREELVVYPSEVKCLKNETPWMLLTKSDKNPNSKKGLARDD